ncbi:hypothetical protein [Schleiferilactobacillus perolens]|uniref:Uncharacterized protein n=1 Tax=Schleiferilactobacillus perolens DSM 12744 TaxID=1423792 RepID=A0A0R1N624_9LACO|nr:hypothetical protein [Schleiferilactobacillus perolens]KRL13042.1 hypothetical protein FD09_GL002582 [Schleiferilactobacillus perolens DSM 12744]
MNKEEAKTQIHMAFANYFASGKSAPAFAADLYAIVDKIKPEHKPVQAVLDRITDLEE